MKRKIVLVLLQVFALIGMVACNNASVQPGTLGGTVTIGPIWPVERPGQNPPVPPTVFEARKILVYDANHSKVLKTVDITQIDQSAQGTYSVQLAPGTYVVDIPRTGVGGSKDLPTKIQISSGQAIRLDIDIDTGIR